MVRVKKRKMFSFAKFFQNLTFCYSYFTWNQSQHFGKWNLANYTIGFGELWPFPKAVISKSKTIASKNLSKWLLEDTSLQSSTKLNSRKIWVAICKNEKFSLTEKNSSNQLFSNFFSKTIAFTKFLRKKCDREFLQFPHCVKNSTLNWFDEK